LEHVGVRKARTVPTEGRIDYSKLGLPKPETRKKAKDREDRAEARVVKVVRHKCEDRDGHCRLSTRFPTTDVAGPCWGPSEWAHLRGRRRSQTVNEAPERRHTTRHTAMLCRQHHAMEERGTLVAIPQRPKDGADGPMTWTSPKGIFAETEAAA
jgi:hypothetical protein